MEPWTPGRRCGEKGSVRTSERPWRLSLLRTFSKFLRTSTVVLASQIYNHRHFTTLLPLECVKSHGDNAATADHRISQGIPISFTMTSLQKQLATIAASSTHQLDLKAQRTAHGKSLLFEPKVAALQSFDTIYAICYDGYRNLCAIDPRFLAFSRTLFSEQSKDEDRAQKNKADNDDLDKILESFITLVGPRLLLKPAEKALEWLVRRFR